MGEIARDPSSAKSALAVSGLIVVPMAEWWSVEVFHGEFRASSWQDSGAVELPEPGADRAVDLTAATLAGAAAQLCPTV
jgi:hypothetical protein